MEFEGYRRWAATALLGVFTGAVIVLGYRAYRAREVPGPPPAAPAGDEGTGTPAGGTVGWPRREPPAPVGPAPGSEAPRQGPEGREALAVHVAGAVAAPGVHRLEPGARVADAVAAAQPLPEALPGALNLARPVADGDKIFVPSRRDLAPGANLPPEALGADHGPAAAPPRAGAGGREAGVAGTAPGRVNLNTAGVEELMTLPGIGRVLAERIVEHRRRVERFRSIEDLLQVPGIGASRLEQLRPYLTL
ncbi:ComEA family DNA-binding protein [Caldinitratiruptor microaerophilus]|uniref:Competence protein ComEA n=1 Tax=Caldinitratiruptor microaerophilus TaxID=671077 RepID=A0AA35CLD3_9FIRM|nr:helix-hairpin-helix domain-containing protein [Caldinitratiruptor microaerophilus]BDG61455.1 competence protein ComEA [Caldinitratiruptor microaerophilus]